MCWGLSPFKLFSSSFTLLSSYTWCFTSPSHTCVTFNATPWVYTLLHALFPSICQENWSWTLKMSHEMRRDLGISLQVGQFKQIRLPYCQNLQQKRKCLSYCRQPDSLRWTLTLDGLNRKELYPCSKCVNTCQKLIVFTSKLNDATLWETYHPFPLWPFNALPAAAAVVLTQTEQVWPANL